MLNCVDGGSQIGDAIAKIATEADVDGLRFDLRTQSGCPFDRAADAFTGL